MNWKGRVVIITGASSGIGEALAKGLAIKGANLVLAARSFVALCELAENLKKKYNIKALAVACDVTKKEDCESLILQTITSFQKIDVLINNAGLSMRSLFKDVSFDVVEKLMQINFFGTLYCSRYAMPYLLKTKGSLVGISSIAGIKGIPGRSGYSASKFAMNGLLEVIRIENLETGLHVLTVLPGFTATKIRSVSLNSEGKPQGESHMDEKKLMSAEEVAKHTIIAIEKRKKKLILTTQGKLVSLASRFIPSILDRSIFNHFKKENNSLLK